MVTLGFTESSVFDASVSGILHDWSDGLFSLVGEVSARRAVLSDGAGTKITLIGRGLDKASTKVLGFNITIDGEEAVAARFSEDVLMTGPITSTSAKALCNNEVIEARVDYSGLAGNVIMTGSDFGDRFLGAGGHDAFRGDKGDDVVRGHAGKDYLDGGNGRDDVRGGNGNDVVIGGNGRDKVWGGNGVDTFVFDGNDQADKIKDFTADDYLLLVGMSAGEVGLSGTQSAADALGAGAGATLGDYGGGSVDLGDIGLSYSEAGGTTRVVMSGGTTMIVKNTTAKDILLDQIYLSTDGIGGALTDLNGAIGIGSVYQEVEWT